MFLNRGGVGSGGGPPDLVKALDLVMNSANALMLWLVPSSSERARVWEALDRMGWCWVYLGHSLMIWLRVSRVSILQGQ